MIQLRPGAHVHLMGICGTAMASLAGLLKDRGFRVTGSDQNVYPPMSTQLAEMGIEVMEGYRPENLNPRPDFVVIGNVISRHFPEAQAVEALGIPFASLPETIGELIIGHRQSWVVAGTHGKTTTTSMLAWAAEQAQLQPGFLIGGIAKNFSRSFQNPKADHFVIEGDEYDSAYFAKCPKFLFYRPQSVILTSVEFDHADIYADLSAVCRAFASLLEILPVDRGLLIYNGEDQNIAKLVPSYLGKKVSYGRDQADWTLKNLRPLHGGIEFDVLYRGTLRDHLFVPMFGQYNALNALAVYALMSERGYKLEWPQTMARFQGVRRRQELIGEPRGIQVIEDFAHHPTAVRGTLLSFTQREKKGRVFAVFEPRSNTSRRKIFQNDYREALQLADRVWVSQPHQKEGQNDNLMDVGELVGQINQKVKASGFTLVEEAIAEIKAEAQPGDTIVIMSNGGFQGIYQKLLQALA